MSSKDLNSSTSWIEFLNDADLVARIQALCGLKWKHKRAQHHPSHELTNNISVLPCINCQTRFDPQGLSHNQTENSGSERESNFGKNEAVSQNGADIGSRSDKSKRLLGTCGHYEEAEDDYEIEQTFWYHLAKVGGLMGDEIFYSIFFPFWFWNIDGAVFRRVMLIWGILMYIGQGLKDVIRWPRPSSPPVIRLEKKWEVEYGMPSTHAIAASAVPFSVLFFTSSRYQYDFTYALAIACLWCTVVSFSRIILGMHSVLDVIAGLSLVTVLFPWITSLADALDPFLVQNEYGALSILLVGILLAVMIPGGDKWTPARADTVTILATCVGVNIGAWSNFQLGIIRGPPLDPPYSVLWPSYGMLGLCILRFVLGVIVMLTIKALVKKSTHFFIGKGFNRITQHSRVSQTPSAGKIQIFSELTQKFITYFFIGFTVVFICPAIFRFIGIQRPTFHTEV